MQANVITLQNDHARLKVVPQMGGGLAGFDLRTRAQQWLPILRPWRGNPEDGPFALACNILVPWSNRISQGSFQFEDRLYRMKPNFPGEPYPIHGNAFQLPWQVSQQSPESVTLNLDSQGPEPYSYRAELRYSIESGELLMELTVQNLSPITLPFGMGFQPWFRRFGSLELFAPARSFWSEAPDHLPVARIPVEDTPALNFNEPKPFPDTWINSAFEGWNGQASLYYPNLNLRTNIRASESLPVYVLYSPSTVSAFACFNPVSHVPDAFHMAIGETEAPLLALQPGAQMSCWLRIQSSLQD